MPTPIPVTFPLINPNEPEAALAAVHVQPGQAVQPGDLLCTLETTKSAADVLAEAGGYVIGLAATAGEMVRAGQVFCYLAESAAETPPALTAPAPEEPRPEKRTYAQNAAPTQPPPGLRITQPALALARQLGLNLAALPVGPLLTEQAIRAAAQQAPPPPTGSPRPFDPSAIVIYGAGGHGKALLDLLRTLGAYHVVGFLDDGIPAGTQIMGAPVLGGAEQLPRLAGQGLRLAVNAVGGIGSLAVRIQVFERLAQAGFGCPALVHPTAFVEPSASLEAGVQVMPQAYVGSEARVGFGSIINTGAIVSHECQLGEYANISPGAILAGQVQVGARALVGMGATINLRAKIGAQARIGNNATVKSDVPENGIVRAGAVWPAQA